MKKVCRYVGYNESHAYFHDKEEIRLFKDTTFIDIPRTDWEALGRPMILTITIEPGNVID